MTLSLLQGEECRLDSEAKCIVTMMLSGPVDNSDRNCEMCYIPARYGIPKPPSKWICNDCGNYETNPYCPKECPVSNLKEDGWNFMNIKEELRKLTISCEPLEDFTARIKSAICENDEIIDETDGIYVGAQTPAS